MIPLAHKSFIRDTVWSDHSLVFLVIKRPQGQKSPRQWKLKQSILSDPVRTIEIERAITDYFHNNDVDEVSPATLWAEHKATVREKLIQLSSQIIYTSRADIEHLERDFLNLSKQQNNGTLKLSSCLHWMQQELH